MKFSVSIEKNDELLKFAKALVEGQIDKMARAEIADRFSSEVERVIKGAASRYDSFGYETRKIFKDEISRLVKEELSSLIKERGSEFIMAALKESAIDIHTIRAEVRKAILAELKA